MNSEIAKREDLNVNEGAYVSGFAENGKSAAKDAGIQLGDVVVKMDDAPIKSSTALIEYVGRKRPGDGPVHRMSREELQSSSCR